MDTMPLKRSSLNLNQEGNKVIIEINALDVTAFRANINSILQFCNVVDTIVTYVEQEKK